MVSWQKPSAPHVAVPVQGVAPHAVVHCWSTQVRPAPHSVLNTQMFTFGTQLPPMHVEPAPHAWVASQPTCVGCI
jgi:ABC-type transporter lipoprotein component MlaA